jgi:hypothetical protein
MDCERFDEYVMDALYGELDELSAEALKRHVEGCPRCSNVLTTLKSTRAALQLPVVTPSDDLHDRILEAERVAVRRLPFHRKLIRSAAWAGSHAMRPQLAMAAVLMLVVGSSMMLLRARPGSIAPPVTVLEEGRPAPDDDARSTYDVSGSELPPASKRKGDKTETESVAAPTPAAAPPPRPAAEEGLGEDPLDEGVARGDGKDSTKADKALEQALGLMKANGCGEALPAFAQVEKSHPGSRAATKARDAQRDCLASGGVLPSGGKGGEEQPASPSASASASAAPPAQSGP